MYTRQGLVYRTLDREGNKVGVPIKASGIYGKPTLKTFEEKFKLNEALRKPFKAELIKTIDAIIARYQNKDSFQKALSAKGIQVIFCQNDEGGLYGVTFIDQNNKAVFNGIDLGKAYSANLLSAKFQPEEPAPKITTSQQSTEQKTTESYTPTSNNQDELLNILFAAEREDLVEKLKLDKQLLLMYFLYFNIKY